MHFVAIRTGLAVRTRLGSIFFGDFRKGFDLIDHSTLLRKLHHFNLLHPCIVRWLAAILKGRSQYVKISNVPSSILPCNGGIPQGNKLGPILFAIMVDELVRSWPLRAKFVDDLNHLRDRTKELTSLVNDVYSYANEHKIMLNPTKCKCIVVDFLDYNSCTWSPIYGRRACAHV